MKKLQRLLLIAFFSIGIYGNTYAQITEDATQAGVIIGSIHTYNVADHTATGSTYTWSVVDVNDNPITESISSYEITDASINFSRTIKWLGSNTYYLKVVETLSTNCSNFYVVKVDVTGDSYSVQFVSTTVPSNSVYCADDSALGSPEITLDIKLGTALPADTYYPMNVFYSLDGGITELSASFVDNTKKAFNLGAIDIGADKTAPNTTAVKVTLIRVVDANGVIFNPIAGNEEFDITINPIPGKPTITF